MILSTKYLSYWTRVRQGFLIGFLVVASMILYSYFEEKNNFKLYGFSILGFGIIYMIISLIYAKRFVNKVEILENKFIVTGYDFNSIWEKEIDISNSNIKIKSKGQGRGNVKYFLRIITSEETIDINNSLTWDYNSLLTIFKEFKRIKGEKIILMKSIFLTS